MKLHRICATNINSLYDKNELDLDQDLQGAALFLIQGPTGAGKTSLMDTVSLALFGSVPRQGDGKSAAASVAELVMSRGAWLARAEVEFSKLVQGRRERYRAAWQVSRAYKKADGTLGAPHRSLERWDPRGGTWVGRISSAKAKEYKPIFDEVLEGFDELDFQRSMLLAQGRFDELLHAQPAERARILERLTHSHDYERLGRRAADLNRLHQGHLKSLEDQRTGLGAPDPAATQAAEAAAAAATLAIADLDATLERLKNARAWQVQAVQLDEAARRAHQNCDNAAQAHAAAAPRRAALANHDRCAHAFPLLDQIDLLRRRAQRLADQQRILAETLPGLRAAAQAAVNRRDRRLRRAEALRAALDSLRGPVAQAQRAADARAQAQAELTQAHRRAEEAKSSAEARAAAAAAAVVQAEAQARAAEAAQRRLDALAADAALEAQLPALRAKAAAAREAALAEASAAQRLADGQRDVIDTNARLEEAISTLQAWSAAHLDPKAAQVERAQLALTALLDGIDVAVRRDDLEAQASAHRRRREALQAARPLQLQREAAQAEAAARAATWADRDQQVALADAAQVDALAAQEAAAAALPPLALALAPLLRIDALRSQRAALAPADPCPLCGSPDHPFVDDPAHAVDAALDAEIARLRADEAAAQVRLRAADRALQDAGMALAVAQAARTTAAAEAAKAADAATLADQRAAQALQLAGLEPGAPLPLLDAAIAAAAAAEGAATAARAALLQATDALAKAQEALRAAEAVRATKIQAVEALRGARAQQEAQVAIDEAALADHRRRREAADQAQDAALTALSLPPGPAGLTAAEGRAAAHRSAQEARAKALHEQDRAEAVARAAADAAAQAARQAAEAAADHRLRQDAFDAAARAEAGAARILDGVWRAAADLDEPGDAPRRAQEPAARLADQQDRTQRAEEQALQARREAEQATAHLQAAEGNAAALEAQAADLVAETARAQARLDHLVWELHLPDVAALAAARLPDAQVPAERAALQALDQALTAAQASAAAADRAREAHAQARPPEADLPLEEALDEATRDRAAQHAALVAAQAILRAAEEKAAQLAALAARIAAASAQAQVWSTLHGLIGVKEGAHFRDFAQALNLRQLVHRANAHLRALSPRYELAQELDPDSQLPSLAFAIIDRYQPGRMRTPRSLSGGETFLVSLSLALGLSDLRTTTMPIETLLLDEGFGTLDADTLDVALGALEQLQASGRQVGIISHVGALRDRIPAQVRIEPLGEGRSRIRV